MVICAPGHLSFPPSQASPPSAPALSFWRGLLVICPAWVDSPEVSCFTPSTNPQPSALYLGHQFGLNGSDVSLSHVTVTILYTWKHFVLFSPFCGRRCFIVELIFALLFYEETNNLYTNALLSKYWTALTFLLFIVLQIVCLCFLLSNKNVYVPSQTLLETLMHQCLI